jgi:hypothetical protein
MPYCSASDVRLLSGVTSDIVSDSDINSLIAFSDQQIDDDIQSFVTVPTRIKNLSALLTSVKLFSRSDLRFRLGQSGLSEQQIQENLNTWKAEVDRIYAYYGKVVPEGPETLGMV